MVSYHHHASVYASSQYLAWIPWQKRSWSARLFWYYRLYYWSTCLCLWIFVGFSLVVQKVTLLALFIQFLVLYVIVFKVINSKAQGLHLALDLVLHQVLIWYGQQFDIRLGPRTISQFYLVEYRDLIHHASSFLNGVEIELALRNIQVQLNGTLRQNEDLVRELTLLQDFLIFIKEFLFQDYC